jgi:putative ABC transport system permease protein
VTVAGIAWRSLRGRALASALTALAVALSVGLVVLVVRVRGSARSAFDAAGKGYDVVVGGVHTPPLASVLSTVFHADKPLDLIPATVVDDLKKDPRVRHAVPFATGDFVKGFRVVGTTPEFFDAVLDASGRPLRERLADGVLLPDGEEHVAVVGSLAASRGRLGLGATFRVAHGEEKGHEHDELWTVVGVLAPTGTPNDRAVFVTLESFWDVKDHEGAGKSLTSVVVRLASPALRFQYAADLRKRPDVQAAVTSQEISSLFAIVEDVDAWFRVVMWLVAAVSGIAILVGLLNSIHGRRREIAILRSLGARPAHVFGVLVVEGALLCVAGGLAGVALGEGGVAAASPWLLDLAGVRVGPSLGLLDLWALGAAMALGAVAALLPAWRALRVPVAANLHPVD